jgi:hypothetical protein
LFSGLQENTLSERVRRTPNFRCVPLSFAGRRSTHACYAFLPLDTAPAALSTFARALPPSSAATMTAGLRKANPLKDGSGVFTLAGLRCLLACILAQEEKVLWAMLERNQYYMRMCGPTF